MIFGERWLIWFFLPNPFVPPPPLLFPLKPPQPSSSYHIQQHNNDQPTNEEILLDQPTNEEIFHDVENQQFQNFPSSLSSSISQHNSDLEHEPLL